MDYRNQRIEQYQIKKQLGQGGMATVYLAHDTRLERDVAIKLVRKGSIPPDQLERILKRFEREAKALAKFLHPNIVPVYDYGEFKGAPYFVMAYLSQGILKERIGKQIEVQTALHWVAQIAGALNYAHQRGFVHRDVKPSNILFSETDNLMLSDFGIAQVLEEMTTQLTVTGMGVGTPEYMAPEQWQGKSSKASDQYALGVVLFELLTGQKPFTADTPLGVALKVMSEPLPSPNSIVGDIPEAAGKLLYKALERDPGNRFESMETFHLALNNASIDISTSQVQLLQEQGHQTTDQLEPPINPMQKKLADAQRSGFNGETMGLLDNENTPQVVTKGGSYYPTQNHLKYSESETFDSIAPRMVASAPLQESLKDRKHGQPDQLTPKITQSKIVWILGAIIVLVVVSFFAGQSLAHKTKVRTAFSAHSVYAQFVNEATLVFEEGYCSLAHIEDGFITSFLTGIEAKNFALEAHFVNPYAPSVGDWDYGLLFRDQGRNDEFRLFLTSEQIWHFENWAGKRAHSNSGNIFLNTAKGEINTLKFLALHQEGYVFVNDQFITKFDLSDRNFSGAIGIGTGFLVGNKINGYFTEIRNLRIFYQ